MDITETDLHRCLWALPGSDFARVVKALKNLPTVRALATPPEHNFVPVFCLPSSSTVPVLRSRVALPRKQKAIIHLATVQVQISMCLPVAIYGETHIRLSGQGCAYTCLPPPAIGVVKTPDLLEVAQALIDCLRASDIALLTRDLADRPLPEAMHIYSLATYLDVLFMPDDYPY